MFLALAKTALNVMRAGNENTREKILCKKRLGVKTERSLFSGMVNFYFDVLVGPLMLLTYRISTNLEKIWVSDEYIFSILGE